MTRMLDVSLEANFNLSLIDPAKWGWSAGGKVVEVQTPHEVRHGDGSEVDSVESIWFTVDSTSVCARLRINIY